MKYLKITSKLTFEQLDQQSEVNLSKFELELAEELKKLYSFEYIQTCTNFGMIVCISDNYLDKLVKLLNKIDKNIFIEDLTKIVLFGQLDINVLIGTEYSLIKYYTEQFINENLTIDIVLDKILEYGKESLTNRDLILLKSNL